MCLPVPTHLRYLHLMRVAYHSQAFCFCVTSEQNDEHDALRGVFLNRLIGIFYAWKQPVPTFIRGLGDHYYGLDVSTRD